MRARMARDGDRMVCACGCTTLSETAAVVPLTFAPEFKEHGPVHFGVLWADGYSAPSGRPLSAQAVDAAVAAALTAWNGIEPRRRLLRARVTGAEFESRLRAAATAALNLVFLDPAACALHVKWTFVACVSAHLPKTVGAVLDKYGCHLGPDGCGVTLDDLLWCAFCHFSVPVMDLLLQRGANPNIHTRYADSNLPLLVAAAYGLYSVGPAAHALHTAIVKLLLRHGVRTDVTNARGANALHYAACAGFDEACTALLDAGVDVDVQVDLSRATTNERFERLTATPLYYAVTNGRENNAVVRVLLRRGASPFVRIDESASVTVLSAAIAACSGKGFDSSRGAQTATLALLIREGPPRPVVGPGVSNTGRLEFQSNVGMGCPAACTAVDAHGRDLYLEQAAAAGLVAPVLAMLGAPTDRDTTCRPDRACASNHAPVDGRVAALAIAANRRHATVVDAILKRGWPPAAPRCCITCAEAREGVDPHAAFLLAGAAAIGADNVIAVLAQHGALRRVDEACKLAALSEAAAGGHEGAVKQLLDAGCDARAASANGATALHAAALRSQPDTAALLLDAGANVNALLVVPVAKRHTVANRVAVTPLDLTAFAVAVENAAEDDTAERGPAAACHALLVDRGAHETVPPTGRGLLPTRTKVQFEMPVMPELPASILVKSDKEKRVSRSSSDSDDYHSALETTTPASIAATPPRHSTTPTDHRDVVP